MKKVRIAQIGTSEYSHGVFIFNALKALPDVFEIAGYNLPEGEREKFPRKMATFEGYKNLTLEEILNDPTIEAVAIETEEVYLSKYALLAAKAGKHIHMEKPGGTSLEEFERLIACVKEQGKVFQTGYMYRYNPEIQWLLEQVKAGELGEIISVDAQMNCYHTKTEREWLQTFRGGSTFFLGCHLIDLILLLKGFPEKVYSLNKSTGLDGVCAEDFGMAILEYANGVSFAKVNYSEVGGVMRRQLVVSGSKKTVEIKPLEVVEGKNQYSPVVEYSSKEWTGSGVMRDKVYYNRYQPMMSAFADMVRGKISNPYTYEYELELYKTILRCCGEQV